MASHPKHAMQTEATEWIGGGAYVLQKQQFQLLHGQYGLQLAIDWAETMITWRDKRRPSREQYTNMAFEYDIGDVNIPPAVERQFAKRLDHLAKTLALQTVKGTAAASQQYAAWLAEFIQKARETGEVPKDTLEALNKLSSSFMHANNGTGFVYRELAANVNKQQAQQQINIGNVRVISSRSQPNKKRPPIIEGEVRELAAG